MAKHQRSAGELIAELSASMRRHVVQNLEPIVRKIAQAAGELEKALGAASEKGKSRAARSGVKKEAGTGKAQKVPRGSLPKAIRRVFAHTRGPLRLSQIRDGVLKQALYKGRKPKGLYVQILHGVRRMSPEITRTSDGRYVSKGK